MRNRHRAAEVTALLNQAQEMAAKERLQSDQNVGRVRHDVPSLAQDASRGRSKSPDGHMPTTAPPWTPRSVATLRVGGD
jgi:hypothetical protein